MGIIEKEQEVEVNSNNHEENELNNQQAVNINNTNDSSKKENPKTKLKSPSLGVVTKRQGGGTLIESRPIFSHDAKYLYVNCGWGLKAFSIKTGEYIRLYDAIDPNGNVVAALLYKKQPTAVTSNGYFITWEAKSGKILMKYKVPLAEFSTVTNAYLVTSLTNFPNPDLCLTIRHGGSDQISLLFVEPEDGKLIEHPLNYNVVSSVDKKHNVSFGGPDDFPIMASISTKGLSFYSLNGRKSCLNISLSGGRFWTCVRCHPTQEIVAVGDNTGRVVVFKYPLSTSHSYKPSAVYHWHHLACQDIAFSPEGSTMFTGGGENVLVKWTLEAPHIRYYLPRLAADIVHINISPDNQLLAVATLDNAIQVVEPPIRLKCVLQQLAWGVLPTAQSSLFPAGLAFEPRTRALALNGRPGHLQFYSPLSESILFNLDVTLQNYITQERTKVIMNTEVTHVAVTRDGAWLATIETREDPEVTIELRLKLWHYLGKNKNFSLNTSIELPHDGKACSLVFQPCSSRLSTNDEINFDYLLATTGTDKKFRLWAPRDLDSIYRKGITWACENACYYRDLDCGPASFSEDGSLLAVGFISTITVWDVDSVNLKESLTNGNDVIKMIEFGMKECCHLLVSVTDDMLVVWNLLTLRLSWKVPVKTSILAVDPYSTYMAAFTTDNKLFVFSPQSTEVVYESERVCKGVGHVISTIFIPRERAFLEGPHWLQNSFLYYIDSNQELICFESEEESGELSMLKVAHDNDPGTLFSALVAAQHTSSVKKTKATNKPLHFGILGTAAVTQLLQAPAHTMPPVSLLCGSLLQSFIISKKTYEKTSTKSKGDSMEENEEGEEEEEEASSSDDEADTGGNVTKISSEEISELLNDNKLEHLNTKKSVLKSNSIQTISEIIDKVGNSDAQFIIDE